MEEWWDTTTLCEAFNVDGAVCMLVDMTPVKNYGHGWGGHNKGAIYPDSHKGGRLMKDGVVYEFGCIMHFAKEHGLNNCHVGNVLNGKRRSHKGWVLP
mgnify:CR=1 FL=1